jgi:hypothetical protein
VHDPVDPTVCCDRRSEQGLHRLPVPDVGRQHEYVASATAHALLPRLLERLLGPRRQDEVRALGREEVGRRATDAGGGADDQDRAGLVLRRHGFSTTLMQPSCFFWKIS